MTNNDASPLPGSDAIEGLKREIKTYVLRIGRMTAAQEKAYNELVRLGMPDGDGYSLKTFMKHYKR